MKRDTRLAGLEQARRILLNSKWWSYADMKASMDKVIRREREAQKRRRKR